MDKIRVIDARMGRGKTSAAIAYMEQHRRDKRFLYITPYLTEVERICESCDFEQPNSDHSTKLAYLKSMLRRRRNVASTHSLFYLLDEEALEIIRANEYTLIIDEAIDPVYKANMTRKDQRLIMDGLAEIAEDGFLQWKDTEYVGKLSEYKKMADDHSLCVQGCSLFYVMNPIMLTSFAEVIMMTYLFNGQSQRAYLDYFELEYEVCGIDSSDGYRFSDGPDDPPPLNYNELIRIEQSEKMNDVGHDKFSLSKSWYEARKNRDDRDLRILRNNMNNFFRRKTSGNTSLQLWTCFKSHADKLYGDRRRHVNSFLQMSARATNEYRSRSDLAYLVNRFVDPNIKKFFASKGVRIDEDEYALGEMLQWIWRGCIRDNRPINLYIPSRRMRRLLEDWIEKNSKGDNQDE